MSGKRDLKETIEKVQDPQGEKSLDLALLDQWIREGQLGLARERLLEVSVKSVDRSEALAIANLARRLNMPKLMIRFLKPVVRNPIPNQTLPTPLETALYATALSRLGVFAEAEQLLKGLSAKDHPEVYLYQAMNDMFQWDYVAPIPKLKKYTQSKSISDYERMVGWVNMAASYIWNMQWEEGRRIVSKIQDAITKSADSQRHQLVYGYSFELLAEMSVLQNQYPEADGYLARAQEILSGSKSRYEFFVRKWKTISRTLQSADSTVNLTELRNVRNESIELKDWETYRDCEFYAAFAKRDSELFKKVYYGTPYKSFRQRITKLFRPDFTLTEGGSWVLIPDEELKKENFERHSEKVIRKLSPSVFHLLEDKPLVEKLFFLLCQDFYRPLAFGSLISQLYPDEYFNPESSPQKAWQIIVRLKEWFKEQDLPLDIQVQDENCRLVAITACEIPLGEIHEAGGSEERMLARLSQQFSQRPFSSQDVCDYLGISKRQAQKLCQFGLESRALVQTSAGRATKYRFRK